MKRSIMKKNNRKKLSKRILAIMLGLVVLISGFGATKGFALDENPLDSNTPSDIEEPVTTPEENEPSEAVQEDAPEATSEEATSEEVTEDQVNETMNMAPASAFMEIQAASTTVDDLKTQIESATSDLTINLDPGVYEFTSQIKTTQGIKITLNGAADGTTEFKMATSVTGAPRFIRAESGTLELNNITVTGTKGVNGGISARNVSVTNTTFVDNYTTDGVNGGGAIRVTGGTLNIEGSTFTGNSVAPTSDGGAVSAENSGNVTINNSVFDKNERIGNQNQYGGALSIKNPGVAGTVISITNSAFTNNKNDATGNMTRGGAIQIFDQAAKLKSATIDNVLFKNNTVVQNNGGALAFMAIQGSTTTTVSNSTFIGNTAGKYGGAIYYEASTGTGNKIINSTFVGNQAKYILGTGGNSVGAYGSKVTIDSSTLINNAPGTQGTGSVVTVKDSILSDITAPTASGTIVYTGTNLAKFSGADPAVTAASVFTAYTATTLEKVSDYNYVAPLIVDGPAYEKVDSTTRTLATAQNGLARKTPLSDIGAYEAPEYYTVSFEPNNSGTIADQRIETGGLATEPTEPTNGVKVFAGWYTDDVTFANQWDFNTNTVTSDVTLYAKWDDPKMYHITYDSNGVTRGVVPADSTNYLTGENATILDPGSLEKTGYTFVEWNTNQDGTGIALKAGDAYTVTEDTTLYAQWKVNTYNIHFDANGGTGTMNDEPYTYGESKPLDKDTYVRDGYTFIGWSTTATGSVEYTDEANYTFDGLSDITLYAQWEKNITPDPVDPVDPVKPTQVAKGESAVAKPVATSAQTGDNTNLTLYIILGAVALVGLLILGIKKSKSKKEDKEEKKEDSDSL